MELTIYVPVTPTTIDPGSAIVGTADGDRIVVDYESDRYGHYRHLDAAGRWHQNLQRAAGRHLERYPTVARQWATPTSVQPVGTYDPDTETVHIDQPATFDAWLTPLGVNTADIVAGAHAAHVARAQLALARAARRGDPVALRKLAQLRKPQP